MFDELIALTGVDRKNCVVVARSCVVLTASASPIAAHAAPSASAGDHSDRNGFVENAKEIGSRPGWLKSLVEKSLSTSLTYSRNCDEPASTRRLKLARYKAVTAGTRALCSG